MIAAACHIAFAIFVFIALAAWTAAWWNDEIQL